MPSPPTMSLRSQRTWQVYSRRPGAQTDAAYMIVMLPHHAGGIAIDSRGLPNLKRLDMIPLATKSQAVQAREIGQMQVLLQ